MPQQEHVKSPVAGAAFTAACPYPLNQRTCACRSHPYFTALHLQVPEGTAGPGVEAPDRSPIRNRDFPQGIDLTASYPQAVDRCQQQRAAVSPCWGAQGSVGR